MNVNNWSGKKKVLVLFAGIFAIVGLILTIFLVQKVQEIRTRAEKATVLSLSPTNQNVNAGEEGNLEVIVNPGVNQVNFIKTGVMFDPDIFEIKKEDVKLNPALGWSFVEQPSLADGTLTFAVAVGSDPTLVISKTTQKLITITFKVKDGAEDGDSDFTFDVNNTQIRSVGGGDPFIQNVLSGTLGATVTIGAPICRPNVGKCSWDPTVGATSYHYKITRLYPDAKKGEPTFSPVTEGDTSDTRVEFDSVPGATYKCEVTAVSECGQSPEASGTSKCPTPSPTPTPSPSPSPTPEKTPTPTPTEEVPTETPAPTEEITPTPTEEIVLTTVPSLPPQGGVTTTPAAGGVTTPAPTLPPTGNPFVIGGILGGVLFILGGLALLFL